jgi:hypothetical protein
MSSDREAVRLRPSNTRSSTVGIERSAGVMTRNRWIALVIVIVMIVAFFYFRAKAEGLIIAWH